MRRTLALAGVVATLFVIGFEVLREDSPALPATERALVLRVAPKLATTAPAVSKAKVPADKSAHPTIKLRLDLALGSLVASAHAQATAPSAPPAPPAPSEPPVAPPSPAPATPPARALPPGSVRIDLLERPRDLGEPVDAAEAFGPKSWLVVPPPPPAPPPPPPVPPRAPPLPFRYMGQIDDGNGAVTYFLLRGTATLSVSVGDTIDNTYRLDSAEGGALQFTFLPLRERQSLHFGVAQ